ncbi:MAG: energy transducer TonB, partial [Marinosulfonomonas sp.]|nr:energy transducer TonB [Marinosulfonomonas sp.]
APDVPQPPAQDNPVVIAPPAEIAAPRPVERVAPTPVEAPPPDVEVADETHEETAPDAEAQAPPDPEPPTAPEEAVDRIVTEADEPPSSAPASSARPSARPKRPTPPVQTAEPATDSTRDAIEAALADVQNAENTPPATPAPTGPPLSGGVKDAFLVDVGRCWNVGSLSTAALESKVIVRFELAKDGKPNIGSIHMTGFEGGTESTARQAYETARRAIIRCGVTGYKLPIEKYEQWKIVNITFNPENMRLK